MYLAPTSGRIIPSGFLGGANPMGEVDRFSCLRLTYHAVDKPLKGAARRTSLWQPDPILPPVCLPRSTGAPRLGRGRRPLIASAVSAHAQAGWIGAGSSNWLTTDNWSDGGLGLAAAQSVRQRLRSLRGALLATTALVAVTAFAPGAARAQDATWLPNPASGNFNTAANWNPATVPTGTAFFGTSNTTALTFSAPTTVGGWTFNAGASAYTFNNNQSLNFNGAGIVINGGSAAITNTVVAT